MEMYTVYILYSKTADRYYIRQTNDIEHRIAEHNDPLANKQKYGARNGPWVLCYSEPGFASRAESMKREKEIKSWKSRKMIERLIQSQKRSA